MDICPKNGIGPHVKTFGLKYKHGVDIIVKAQMQLILWWVLAIISSHTMVQTGLATLWLGGCYTLSRHQFTQLMMVMKGLSSCCETSFRVYSLVVARYVSEHTRKHVTGHS